MERAIEVGPGGGPYIELLCDLFAEVVATDVEESYLDHVRATHGQRDNLHMLLDDITRSRLDPESFDLVLCSEVIEHISDPHGVLRGIFRLLRPGGVLVLSTPQAYSTVELVGRLAFRPGVIELARLVYREPVLPTGHISLLTRRRLATLLSETGFLLDSTALTGVYLPGVAELGGRGALRLEQGLARRLSHGPLSWLLWTQHWTCERPS